MCGRNGMSPCRGSPENVCPRRAKIKGGNIGQAYGGNKSVEWTQPRKEKSCVYVCVQNAIIVVVRVAVSGSHVSTNSHSSSRLREGLSKRDWDVVVSGWRKR